MPKYHPVRPPRGTRMIYTPKHHIPLGEIRISPGGQKTIVIKKAQSPVVEEISIADLILLMQNVK